MYVATDQPNKLLLHNPLCEATTCLRFDCHTFITIYPTTHIPYIGNHSRKKSFANELLWHSSRENIRDSANPRKFNCPYIDREIFSKENFHEFINNRGVPKYTSTGIYRILRKCKFLCSWLPRISRNMDSSKWRVFKL